VDISSITTYKARGPLGRSFLLLAEPGYAFQSADSAGGSGLPVIYSDASRITSNSAGANTSGETPPTAT